MDPLAFLSSLERLGMKFGLENMRVLCAELGHPEHAFHSVLVGGTNGKGSVTAMVSMGLHAAGHRVGRYTSPHLERLEERFVINEQEIETADLRDTAGVVQSAVERLIRAGTLPGPPTFFECTTAVAFELFRRRGVQVAILEVGLGGRLDATNVVSPVAAAITSIDYDHQALLGNTLEAIAAEKAGIIRPGVPVVCGPLPDEADRVMVQTCRDHGAAMIRALDRVAISSRSDRPDSPVTLRSDDHEIADMTLALRGRHQTANAAVAFCLMEELKRAGLEISTEAMRAGLTETRWPARLEHRRWHGCELLLDAAHNPAGARALASYLDETGWTRTTLLFGAMRDKDAAGILTPVLPHVAHVICTTALSARALGAEELVGVVRPLARGNQTVEAVIDPAAALEAACARGGRVVIAGSIFLVGPLRGILR